MHRRDFFRLGLRRTAETVLKVAEARAEHRAMLWIRPPFAIRELDFLLGCTRCDDCVSACPHGVIFKLPVRLGVRAAGTPALALANRGCRLCADWPCVAACRPKALRLPETSVENPPVLALVTLDTTHCLPYQGPECGACRPVCPVPGALVWVGGIRPRIDPARCVGCALCREACVTTPKAFAVAPRRMATAREHEEVQEEAPTSCDSPLSS